MVTRPALELARAQLEPVLGQQAPVLLPQVQGLLQQELAPARQELQELLEKEQAKQLVQVRQLEPGSLAAAHPHRCPRHLHHHLHLSHYH